MTLDALEFDIGGNPLADYLEALSSRTPAPGGGAAAAVHGAQSAALLSMVANYTTGPSYAQYEPEITRILQDARTSRDHFIDLAAKDSEAFREVWQAYQRPRDDSGDRKRTIERALLAAAEPPRNMIAAAAGLVAIAERLRVIGNLNVITDVGAAAEAARASAVTARLNLEVNISGISQTEVPPALYECVEMVDDIVERADAVVGYVRKSLHK